MRRIVLAIIGTAVIATITTGLVLALNYEGEDRCRYHVAWPNGTYLGQMHPNHLNFYERHHGQGDFGDPCSTWARDRRSSAVPGLRAMGYSELAPEERITWSVSIFHGRSVYIQDADGDTITVASTGGAAGVPETPLLLVNHAALDERSGGLVERRVSVWIDGERVDWHGIGYAKSASSTWVIASPVYWPQHTPAFPIERLLGADALVVEVHLDASGAWTPVRVEMDLGGDMGVMQPIYIILREHQDYLAWARARGWPIL